MLSLVNLSITCLHVPWHPSKDISGLDPGVCLNFLRLCVIHGHVVPSEGVQLDAWDPGTLLGSVCGEEQ